MALFQREIIAKIWGRFLATCCNFLPLNICKGIPTSLKYQKRYSLLNFIGQQKAMIMVLFPLLVLLQFFSIFKPNLPPKDDIKNLM